jgi:hypothetical protein
MSAGVPNPRADGGPVEQDAPFLGSPESASGLNPGGRVRTPEEGVQAVRDGMVAEVARALGYAGVSPFEIEDWRIEDFADRLHRAGYRRVVEDEDTIERLAKTMAEADGWDWGDEPDREAVGRLMEWDYPTGETRTTEYGAITKPVYRKRARAVVRALREDT